MHRARAAAALVAATTLLLTGCTAATVPVGTKAGAAGVASAVDTGGRSLPFHGLQAWAIASVPTRTASTLTVFAVGGPDATRDPQTGGPCGPPVLRLHAVETAQTVTVFVAEYEQPADPNQVCPAVGYGPSPQQVRLKAALGARSVVDGSTGRTGKLLDGSRYPDLPSAPAAWGPSLLEADFPSYPTGIVTREWVLPSGDGRLVLLESETPQQARTVGADGTVVQHIDLHGTPATVYRVSSSGYFVQWTPNAAQVVSLRLDDGVARTRWSQADAVRLAAAVTGHRTE